MPAQSSPPRRAGRLWVVLLALLLLAGRQPGRAQRPAAGALPWMDGRLGFDIAAAERHTTLPAAATARPIDGQGAAQAPRPALVRLDALTGSASRVRRPGQALTAASRRSPLAIARDFLRANEGLFHLTRDDAARLRPVRQYFSPGLNVVHLTLQPFYGGIPVLQAAVKFDLLASGELLAVSGATVPDLAATLNVHRPRLSPAAALARAARAVGEASPAATPLLASAPGARRTTLFSRGDRFDRPPVLALAYLPTRRGVTRLGWETTLWRRGEPDVFQVVIDAVDGELLYRHNYTAEVQGQVFEREAPQDGSPFLGGVPPLLDRLVEPFDGAAFFGAGDPHRDWWAGASPVVTDANNVAAGTFRDLQNFPPVQSPGSDFSFSLNLAQNPVSYQPAAVVNLFYWVNRCHDIWYGFGFNEAAGNFQQANFGLGGQGGDQVLAAAQFGADASPPRRNNANFTAPPDGQSGVMRMFEFDATNPLRDSDLAADVIAHEFGHGLTNRLIGNGGGLNGFQGGALGEGWSDFQSLMVHARPEDDLTRPHPIGGYLVNDFAAGIRSEPYSANRSAFDRTFGQLGQEIPGFGPEIHLAGEIICNALFQAYGRMVQRLGFAAGRAAAMQLFVDACKLCPDNPTYLDFRDALLTADQTRFAGGNTDDIWFAFAAAGMGTQASTTGVNDLRPVEDFTTPGGGTGVPAAPSNFAVAVANGNSLQCTWTDNAGNETGFLLEIAINGHPFQPQPQVPIPADSASAQVNLAPFTPGAVLALRVRAVNDAGASAASNSASVTVPGGAGVPAGPTNFLADVAAGNRIHCSWTDNASNETGFQLEISVDLGPWGALARPRIRRNATSVDLAASSFEPGALLGFRVVAFNRAGRSLPSNYDAVNVPTTPEPPAPPQRLRARPAAGDAGRTQVNLTFRDRSSNEEGFRVEVAGPGQAFVEIATVAANAQAVQVPNLAPNTTFQFRVRAFNAAGNSAFSNVVTAKTRP